MKKIDSYIKLLINSQEANASPPIGPILGQKGVNILSFCKTFNKNTENIEKGTLLSVKVIIFSDKTFNLIIKSTPTSIIIKNKLNIKYGSKNPGKDFICEINNDDIIKIARLKINDFNSRNIESVCKSIIGTAKSMGIKVLI